MRSGKFLRILTVCLVLTALSCVFASYAGALEYRDDLKIKVGLEFGPTSPAQTSYSSDSGFRVVSFDETTYETGVIFETAHQSITVVNVDGKAVIYAPDGTEIYRSAAETMYFTGISGSVNYDNKTYAEIMKILCKDGLMRVINIVTFETYIKGVLPREVYPSWPEEALKAAAVVARTFGFYSLGGKHTRYGVDVCDTTCCQVFGGNGSNEYASTNAAVEATKHMILAYEGKVAMTVYSSSMGDSTESSFGAWGGNQALHPYLCGVYTPHETPEAYPNGTWSTTVSASELLAYIDSKSAYNGKLRDGIASVVIEHAENGYARKITVTDIYGNSVSAKNSDGVRGMLSKYAKSAKVTVVPNFEDRSAVAVLTADGLCSTNTLPQDSYILRAPSTSPTPLFAAVDTPVSFTISGIGWGHGVGLSQFGAMTLAQNGKTYSEILMLYYPGTYFTTPSALSAPAQ